MPFAKRRYAFIVFLVSTQNVVIFSASSPSPSALTRCHLPQSGRPWQSTQNLWFCQGLSLWESWTRSGLRGRALLQGLLCFLLHLAAAQMHQRQLALLADGALLRGVVGQVQLEGAGQMGMGDGASGLVRSTTQVMPRQMPPASSMTRLVSREEMPVVTTSSR